MFKNFSESEQEQESKSEKCDSAHLCYISTTVLLK